MKPQNMRYKTKRFLGITIDLDLYEDMERLRGTKRTFHSQFINKLLRKELKNDDGTGAQSVQGTQAPEQPTAPLLTEMVSNV